MSSKKDDSASGTVTMIVVSFDMASDGDRRQLTIEDIAKLLNDCLSYGDESLDENESTQALDPLHPARVLH